jgi:esterase
MFSNLSVYYFNIAPLLATKYHVVLYDLKSHGMSEKVLEGYDLESMTNDLIALMEALNLQQVHLGGYSFGGLIALKMAIRFPERIKKLAIIEAPDPNDDKTRALLMSIAASF